MGFLYLILKDLYFSTLKSGGRNAQFEMVPRPPPTEYVVLNHVLQIVDPRGLLMCIENEMSKRFTYDVHRTIHFIFYS